MVIRPRLVRDSRAHRHGKEPQYSDVIKKWMMRLGHDPGELNGLLGD